MLIQALKILISIGLAILLVVLVNQREFILEPKRQSSASLPVTNNKELVLTPPTLEQKEPTQQPQATTVEPSPEIPPVIKQPVIEIETLPKKSVYIQMEEGQSDTDTTYRPAISPCKLTMGYKIGRFDSDFGISQSRFIEEIDAAALLWGNQIGKTLFSYSPNGPLTINLIYDERQATTNDVNNLAIEIQNAKDAADLVKRIYEQEKVIYLGDGEQLTKDSEAFKIRYDLYTAKVTMYNSQGGAPPAIYDEMTKELEALKKISSELTARRDALHAYMEVINTKVNRYNELVAYINSLIEKSNSLGAKKFTEGRFVPRTNTIDIYQYNDLIKLRRVIAHELGHVLGINHTENVYSIMYAVNSATTTTLSADDIAELYEVCPQ